MLKVLITGTPGWLGSSLAFDALKKGWKPTCLIHPSQDGSGLQTAGAATVRGDLTRPSSLEGVCAGIDVVIHCAGIIHPRRPKDFYTVNTDGTAALAREAVKSGVRRFIFVSSSCAGISGTVRPEVTSETDEEIPYRVYGRSKRMAERFLLDLARPGAFEPVIIRPHWMYGPGGPDRQVRFLKQLKSGRPLMFGDGKNLRSLCDVRNCVQALLLAVDRGTSGVYYIGDDRPYTLNEIYAVLGAAAGIRVSPVRVPIPARGGALYDGLDLAMQKVRFYRSEVHWIWEWSKNVATNVQKARRELGYAPLPDTLSQLGASAARL